MKSPWSQLFYMKFYISELFKYFVNFPDVELPCPHQTIGMNFLVHISCMCFIKTKYSVCIKASVVEIQVANKIFSVNFNKAAIPLLRVEMNYVAVGILT